MSKPKKKGEPSEAQDNLDDIFGPDEPDVAFEADGDEPPKAKAEAKAEEPKPEAKPEPEKPAEPEQKAEPERDEPEPEEPREVPVSQRLTPDQIAALERDAEGKKQEIMRLRAKLRSVQAQQQAPQAPNPSPTAQPTPAQYDQAAHQVQQRVDSGEYLPDLITFKDGQAAIDGTKLKQLIQEEAARMVMPSQEQIRAQQAEQYVSGVRDKFISENPPLNGPAWSHAEQAIQYLALSAREKAQEWGVPLENMRFDERMDFFNTSGVMSEVAQRYPHLAPELPDLLRADALEDQEWMRTVLRRYSQRLTEVLGGDVASPQGGPVAAPSQAAPAQIHRPNPNAPPDLSRVGSSTPEPNKTDKARLAELERLENEDPIFFDPGLKKELDRLRDRFKVDDMDWGVGGANRARG